jgi:hypothetical protein
MLYGERVGNREWREEVGNADRIGWLRSLFGGPSETPRLPLRDSNIWYNHIILGLVAESKHSGALQTPWEYKARL